MNTHWIIVNYLNSKEQEKAIGNSKNGKIFVDTELFPKNKRRLNVERAKYFKLHVIIPFPRLKVMSILQ